MLMNKRNLLMPGSLDSFFSLMLLNQMSSAMFRLIASFCRNLTVATTMGSFIILILVALGGFVRLVMRYNKETFFFYPNNGFLIPFCIWSMLQIVSNPGGYGVTIVPL